MHNLKNTCRRRQIIWGSGGIQILNELKSQWQSQVKSDESNIYVWNNDGFLKLLDSMVAFKNDMTVLDIGCGSGVFAIPLSERVAKVTAIDISPKMLDYAKYNADKHKRYNIDYICVNWKNTDLIQIGWKRKFDLVIAHNTPAISDAHSFEKMIQSSRDYCFFAKPTRRTDSVLGMLPKIIGIPDKDKSTDEDIMIALSILWCKGLLPEMIQIKDRWVMKKPLEEASEFYINRLKTYNEIDCIQEEAIRNYLSSIAVNNIVREKTDTAITVIAWRNNRKFLRSNYHERS